ncbi:MAG: transcriptional regulator GcvA [Betaproteobacteria bacterium]|nr:transcriptional regulator GcvA [Betaproteobacteria bacterium]
MHSKRYDVPPLDQLLAFEAAARNLSFTRAAEELFLTQSAVSRQIQSLERDLGLALFVRRPRTLTLTEGGRMLHRTTQEVLQRLHDTTRQLQGVAATRTVTVTTTPAFAALWLIPHLASFTRTNPGVDVRISAANELVNLERAGVDLAVRYAPADSVPDARPLFGETVFPVCAPALLHDDARPLATPADLRRHVLLFLDDARAAWLGWDLWFHALRLGEVSSAGRLHFSHYDQLVQAAVAGQGVALGRFPLVRNLLDEGRLVAPFRQDIASSRTYLLMESAAAREKADVRRFVAWLLAETERERQDTATNLPPDKPKLPGGSGDGVCSDRGGRA